MAGKAATLKILGNNLDAKEKLKQIKEEADRLREESPELTVKINRAQAQAEMAVLKESLKGVQVSADEAAHAIDNAADGVDKFAVVTEADLEAASQKIKTTTADFAWMAHEIKEVRNEAIEADAAIATMGNGKSLAGLKGAFKGVEFGKLGSSLLGLGAIGAAVGPAPVILGGLTAAIGGVAAAVVPAAAGLGLFAGVVKSGITQVIAADAANKKLSGGLGELQSSVKAASSSWKGFTDDALKNGGAATTAKAISLIPIALKAIAPILAPTEKALNSVFGKIGTGLQSSGFKSFVSTLTGGVGPAIQSLSGILGHLGSMFGKVVKAFEPLGQGVLAKLDSFLAKADAHTDSGIQKFLSWLSVNGPTVVDTLKSLGGTLGNLVGFLSKFSSLNIGVFSVLAKTLAIISSNPIGAGALIGLLVLTKVIGVVGPLIKLVGAFKELSGVINLTKIAMIGLDAVPIVLVITLIVAAIVLLITHWNTVKAVAVRVWHDITGAVSKTFNWVKKNWPLLLGILLGPIGIAVVEIAKHWHQIEAGAKSLLGKLESFFKSLPGKILHALGDLGHLLWNAGVSIISGLFGGLVQKFNDVKKFVGGIASWISDHKGPISYDATLLRPHGQVIMGGLVGGLEDGMPSLSRQLSKTTQTIASTKVAASVGGSNAALTAEWIGGAGADQEFITWLKKNIRIRGGNPGVLGR